MRILGAVVRERLDPLWIACMVFVLSLTFLVFLPARWRQNLSPDYRDFYEPAARNLIAGRGYVTPDGKIGLRYPPGFPLALAGIFQSAHLLGIDEALALKLSIMLASWIGALLLYGIARTVFNRRVALLAALLWSSYPFHLWLTKQPNPESPFVVLLFLGVYLLVRGFRDPQPKVKTALGAGLALGAASLVRPISIALCVPLMVVAWLPRPRWGIGQRSAWCGLLVLGNVLAVLPWEVWVWMRTGEVIPLSTNAPYSAYEGLTFALEPQGSRKLLEVDPQIRELMEKIREQAPSPPTTGSMSRILLHQFLEEPLPVLKLVGLKITRAWHATQAQWYEDWIRILQAPYLLLIAGGFWIAVRRFPASRHYLALAALSTLYFWALAIIAVPLLRYMVPAIGLLMVFAAVAAASALERLRPLRRGR